MNVSKAKKEDFKKVNCLIAEMENVFDFGVMPGLEPVKLNSGILNQSPEFDKYNIAHLSALYESLYVKWRACYGSMKRIVGGYEAIDAAGYIDKDKDTLSIIQKEES